MFRIKHKFASVMVFLFLALFFVSCAASPMKGLNEKQSNLLRFMIFYNTQYDDYQRMTVNLDNLSEEKKSVLRQKKAMLVRLYQLIKIYEIQISDDALSSVETERVIYDLLNQIE